MSHEDLVTVYVPTKNRLDLIRRAVDSVLAQTHSALELIVVDDGSSDGTAIYLQQMARLDDRLRPVVLDRSRGAPHARNTAIRMANGFFVTGLDDDDRFLPERLSKLVDYWHLLARDGESPSFIYTQEFGIKGGVRTLSKRTDRASYDEMYDWNRVGNQVFAPKSHFIEAGLFDESLPAWQDLEFFMRMLRMFGTARLLDLPTYEFDNTPRPDRLTQRGIERLRAAFERVASVHAPSGGRARQRLLLQLFRGYYGNTPTMADWVQFLRHGLWLAGVLTLSRASARGVVRRLRRHSGPVGEGLQR